jgi:hypothetical protein
MINQSGLDRVVLYLENGRQPMAELHHYDGSINVIHWDNIYERKTYFEPFFTAYVRFEDNRFVKEPEKFFYDVNLIADGITCGVFECTEEVAKEIDRFCNPKLWDKITEEDSFCWSPSIDLSSKRKKVDHIDRKVELSNLYYTLRMECKSENEEKMQEIKKEYFDLLDEDQKLAIILHDKFCKLVAPDCYWTYETNSDAIHDFSGGYEHSEYLQTARVMLSNFSYEDIIKMINIIPN